MALNFQIKLGQSTSLLAGYKQNIYSVPFAISNKPALFEKKTVLRNPDYDAKWSSPEITLHQNAEDLLSAVLQVKLHPMRGEDLPKEGGTPSTWPSGALMLAGLSDTERHDALQRLSTQLGIDLLTKGWSYALVRRTRTVGTATHECYERGLFSNLNSQEVLKPDALAALKKLEKLEKTSTDINMNGAQGYLNFFENYGTHFVSNIVAGDSIFQVFAFEESVFKVIEKAYVNCPHDFRGDLSYTFHIFTVPRSEDGVFGYAAAAGNICISSEDEEMAKSLTNGLWRDESYAGTNSIFAPYVGTDAIDLNAAFKKVVPISVELASISSFAEYYRMLIWHRIFKGAMYAKYTRGSRVAPFFGNDCPYDLDSVFKDSADPLAGEGLLSVLCTPSVSIMLEKIDLTAIVVRFPEVVKKFAVFSNAIQIPSSLPNDDTFLDVPASRNVTLCGHVITSGGNSPLPPNIRLSDPAFGEIEQRLFCGEFYGALRLSNADDSKSCVVMNGLMMKYTGRQVSIVKDVRDCPSSNIIAERLVDIQFSMVVAEARLNFLLAKPAGQEKSIELMKRLLLWLAEVAGSDEQLVFWQARALYLAKVVTNTRQSGVLVPLLRYEAYKDVVKNVQDVIKTASDRLTNFQNQIRARMAEERGIDREQALNENIIKSGRLLHNYVVSQATYQESLENMFQTVFKDKEEEMQKIEKETKDLEELLIKQRDAVDSAILHYKAAVAEWKKNETIKASLDIASALFCVGFALVVPVSSFEALEQLGKTVQKIKKMAKVFKAVIKAYRAYQRLPDNPQKVIDALKNVGREGVVAPSSLEWEEMHVNFKAVLSTGPDVNEKAMLSAAFEILVLRGKALLESQSAIQKIAADMAAAQQRITLHNDQKKRLDELKMHLNAKPEELDTAKIDLIGLSGQLLFFQRQMLMILASTVVIQDRALQYEYLRQPTFVGAFTMMGLQLAMLRQSQSINQGLRVQPPPLTQADPIIYEVHGVLPKNVTNNRRYTFNININKREFASFNYVRVESVAVEIDGIVSTDSGKYYTELVFDGDPFLDRSFDGETLAFQTTSRVFTGLQKVKPPFQDVKRTDPEISRGCESTTGQDPFSGKISNITPFSKWHVSLPQTSTNKGIIFGDRIVIRLVFRIYAQLKEMEASKLSKESYRYREPFATLPKSNAVCGQDAVDGPRARSGRSDPTVKKEDVLNMMTDKSVCAGWDVIFSMSAKQINEQLMVQYSNRKDNPTFLRETGKQSTEIVTSEGLKEKRSFSFKFNAPKLEFMLNNSNSANICLPIISGSWENSYFIGGKWVIVNRYEAIESHDAYVLGNVNLAIIPGSMSSEQTVAIKLKGGHFEPRGFKAAVSDPAVAAALTDYFAKLEDGYEVYNFGTLDFKQISVLKSLKPTNFLFNVYHTPSNRDLLQLFIATTGALQSFTHINLREPVPSEYECSLIVNSKLFFQDVLPESLGKTASGLLLKEVAPKSDFNEDKVWSCKAIAGSVSSPFKETMVYYNTMTHSTGATTETVGFVKVPNNTVTLNLDGMHFQNGNADSGWNAKLVYRVNKKYSFQYGVRSRAYMFSPSPWREIPYGEEISMPVTVQLDAKLPLEVSGSGQNQTVGLVPTTSDVHIEGKIEPSGTCRCTGEDFQQEFFDKLKEKLAPSLIEICNQKFTSVSLFALENLLFPAKNMIDMKEAYVPGDMVVFGEFTAADFQK